MRKRRLLLAATALSTMACSKREEQVYGNPGPVKYDAAIEYLPLPGNPKGTIYDAAMPDPIALDAAVTDAANKPRPPPRDAGPVIRPLPGNPKGSRYDKGLQPKPKKPDPDDVM